MRSDWRSSKAPSKPIRRHARSCPSRTRRTPTRARFTAGPADQRIEDLGQRARSIDRADGFDEPFACGTLSGPCLGTGIAATLLTPLDMPFPASVLSTRDAAAVFGSGDRIGQAIGGLLFGGGDGVDHAGRRPSRSAAATASVRRAAMASCSAAALASTRRASAARSVAVTASVTRAAAVLFGGSDGVDQAGRGGALGRGDRLRHAGGDGLFGRSAGAGRSL